MKISLGRKQPDYLKVILVARRWIPFRPVGFACKWICLELNAHAYSFYSDDKSLFFLRIGWLGSYRWKVWCCNFILMWSIRSHSCGYNWYSSRMCWILKNAKDWSGNFYRTRQGLCLFSWILKLNKCWHIYVYNYIPFIVLYLSRFNFTRTIKWFYVQ